MGTSYGMTLDYKVCKEQYGYSWVMTDRMGCAFLPGLRVPPTMVKMGIPAGKLALQGLSTREPNDDVVWRCIGLVPR